MQRALQKEKLHRRRRTVAGHSLRGGHQRMSQQLAAVGSSVLVGLPEPVTKTQGAQGLQREQCNKIPPVPFWQFLVIHPGGSSIAGRRGPPRRFTILAYAPRDDRIR